MFVALTLLAFAPSAPPFELKDGDRIAWLGGTLVEREQRYGHWEAALLRKFPDRAVTVRNLGWSGDTVFGDARAGFDTPTQGFERLVGLTLELKPTVVFLSYGANESFDGPAGLANFQAGYRKLLDALAPAKARIVCFTPMAVEPTQDRPTVTERNKQLALYAEAIKDVAEPRGHVVADLFARSSTHLSKSGPSKFTENGIHLTDAGYQGTIPDFLAALGLNWGGDEPGGFERTRAAVRAKNELFFHRWRPQNETYLFGFRKHEQGKNAKEIVEFDPLVAKADEAVMETVRKK